MPNGHKGLEAVKEATALFAAAPDMLAALIAAYQALSLWMDKEGWEDSDETAMVQMWAAITKAKGIDESVKYVGLKGEVA
jgi:hypothetical protein